MYAVEPSGSSLHVPLVCDLRATPPARILVVKLSSMGDIIHVTPCVRALRRAFPRANIVMAVEARWAAVVRRNPHLDEMIECSSDTRLSVPYLWSTRRALSRNGPFDVALDFQGTLRSAAWMYLSGALIKAGRGARRPGWTAVINPDSTHHAVRVSAEICESVGVSVPSLEPEIVLDEADDVALGDILRNADLPSSGFVVVNPFSRWESKEWPEAQAAAVSRRIARETGARVVISGGPDDRARAEALLRMIEPGRAASLAGVLTLGQALCLYKRARVMISCDSGPMHAAAACGTPVVALFGPTHPERTGPWGETHRVLQASRPLLHHAYRTPEGGRHMRALDADAIFAALREQLAR